MNSDGALVAIVGTLVTSAIALLAAVPSVIYGMWGLFVLAPLLADRVQPWLTDHLGELALIGPMVQGPPMGIGVLPAGVILAIMVIPFIAAVTRDVFEIVPPVLKESAHGIGATTWEVVWNVTLPYAKSGVIGGTMLGLGRALGTTMAVTFVIGNAHRLSATLESDRAGSLPSRPRRTADGRAVGLGAHRRRTRHCCSRL